MSEERAAYQLFPELNGDDYAALKADIAERGVMVAVEYDDDGNILDGHHRVRAWTELAYEGVALEPYPRVIREGMSETQKREHVRRLNILRRHLTQEQKRELIRDQVRETPARSDREIGRALGVDGKTVAPIRAELEATAEIPQSIQREGADGRVINTANIGQRPSTYVPPCDACGQPLAEDHRCPLARIPSDALRQHVESGEPVQEMSPEARPVDMYFPEFGANEPIEDSDGEQYATLPFAEPGPPTIGELLEPGFVLPPRGLDPHSKAWHAAVAPAMYTRLDPAAVIATREPKEIERGLEMMAEAVEYLNRLIEAGRAASGRFRLEVVR